jgi:hypothetical protein
LGQMITDFRDRVSLLFSNQLPDAQPIPSWFEVPTRPSEPWAIEIWERDNLIRNWWAEKLNGGYIQANVIIEPTVIDSVEPTTPEQVETPTFDPVVYYSTDWFYDGYSFDEEIHQEVDN